MTTSVDNVQTLQDILEIMGQIKNTTQDLPADSQETEQETELLENQSSSNGIQDDLQDILSRAQQAKTDPKIQALVEEVIADSEQALQDPETQKHVEEFIQANNEILRGLGLPEYSLDSESSSGFEEDFGFNEEAAYEVQVDRLKHLRENPACECYFTGHSGAIDKINNLIQKFDFSVCPQLSFDRQIPRIKFQMLKAIGQFKLFYSHYKGFIQTIDTWLVKNKYVKSTELAQALLGAIQDQFEIMHTQCLEKHPSEAIRQQQILLKADQSRFQATLKIHNLDTLPNQNMGASYYFFKGYNHFKEGKISAYIEDIQNLTQNIRCNKANLDDLSLPYADVANVSKEAMQLYIKSITQFMDYLNHESPIKETIDQAFTFILKEASNMELKNPWQNTLHYENLIQVLQNSLAGLPGVNSVNSSESQYHQVEGKVFEHAEFAIINGINNELEDAMKFAHALKEQTEGHRVHVLFNATQGKIPDLMEWLLTYTGNRLTPAVALTIQFIRDHFKKNPDKKLFFVTHSCGGAILKAALQEIPTEYRDRMTINNMGGGAYIPKSLCKDAINYVSKNDNVSQIANALGTAFIEKNKNEFNIQDYEFRLLEPKPGSPKVDHAIFSPTYQDEIGERVIKFIKKELENAN